MRSNVLGDMLDEVMEAIEGLREEIEQLRETIAVGDLPRTDPPEDPTGIIGESYGPFGWVDEYEEPR